MPGSQPGGTDADSRVVAWDAAVRLLHGSLAALVLFDLWLDDGGWLHRTIGYGAAGVVVARMCWALFAGGTAGLAALKPSPSRTLAYLRGGLQRAPGHDPLGLWMVWLLWSLVLLLGLSGWVGRLDAFWGDDLIRDVHAALAQALLVAVAVHLSGIAAMSWRWRENLVAAMLSGKKRPLDHPD